MKTKLAVAVIAALNLGVLAACSQGADTANTQATSLTAPAPAATAAPEVAPAPAPAVVEAAPAAESAPVAAVEPAPAPKPVRKPASVVTPEVAKVVSVKDAFETISEPREVCQDVQVEKQAPVKDENRVVGTVAGAAAGAVIGNQIGDGKGRKIARVVGIVGGAVAGNQIQKKMQESDTVMETERRCETVTDTREQQVGYDVTYTYAGRTQTVRMKQKPGATLPVRNGEVVTN